MAAPAVETPQPPRFSSAPQVNRSTDEAEARSKIFWGDEPEEVVKFAMARGFPRDEARALVDSMVQERVILLRGIGIRKIVTGFGLTCVPGIAYLIFQHIGVIPIKLFALTVAVGLYGAYRISKGSLMILLPKSEHGDIADK